MEKFPGKTLLEEVVTSQLMRISSMEVYPEKRISFFQNKS
jgi:hypothetical protein